MVSFYKKPLLILLIGIGAAAMVFAGCENKEDPGTTAPSQTVLTTAPEETTPQETPPEETLGIEVETDYITLHYPSDWENKVEPIQTQVDGNQVTTFRTVLFDQEIDLFSIILGPNEAEGYLLGQLISDGQEPINVYSAVNEQNPEDWTKEQYDEICALQERINEITIQIQEDPQFVPNRPI